MPQKVDFTSVEIHHFKRSQSKMSVRFEMPLTKSCASAMGWGELQDWEDGSDLKGDLAASVITLTPSDESLKRHAIDLQVKRVHKFTATRQEIEGKRGKGSRLVVQCDAIVRDEKGCHKLEAYMATVPKSSMRVSYEKQPEQADIPGTEIKGNEELPLQ
jgi:hypothetical protein